MTDWCWESFGLHFCEEEKNTFHPETFLHALIQMNTKQAKQDQKYFTPMATENFLKVGSVPCPCSPLRCAPSVHSVTVSVPLALAASRGGGTWQPPTSAENRKQKEREAQYHEDPEKKGEIRGQGWHPGPTHQTNQLCVVHEKLSGWLSI